MPGLFRRKKDTLSAFRSQQLKQALYKAKKPPVNNVDEKANAFLREYIGYQKANFPSLDLSTKEDKNGWWTDYRTELGKNVYINHKIREGYVDLTFVKASNSIDRMKTVADWARQHKILNAAVVRTANSAMIRLHVPKLDMEKGFEYVDKDELNQCFEAVRELTDFANMIETVISVIHK